MTTLHRPLSRMFGWLAYFETFLAVVFGLTESWGSFAACAVASLALWMVYVAEVVRESQRAPLSNFYITNSGATR